VLSGCGSAGTPSGSIGATRLTSVTVAMGYFANVQFAPFYVAVEKGYYRAVGLDVHFHYGIEPEALRLASAGKVDFVNSGGDEVLAAGARGLHVRYVLTQYSRFPTAIFSLRRSHIRGPLDLSGHSVGVPGTYGATYVGLLALLQRTHVRGVRVQSIGFTQVDAVAHRKVDAAVGYAMNEPVALRQQGYSVNEIDVYHKANIAGAGIAASDQEIAKHPAVVRAFVRATVRGMADTLRDPEGALRASEEQVKEIKVQARIARATLHRCLNFWQPERGHPLGWVDPRIWDRTAQLLFEFGQIPRRVSPTPFYTNRFVLRG
jgi:NitT/TauT family transport system substrate-binding protein